jgi:choline kinase
MRQLVSRGSLGAVEVDGTRWVDVDTPADIDLAETLLHRALFAKS